MDMKELFNGFDPSIYEAEVEERWSGPALDASKRRVKGYTADDWKRGYPRELAAYPVKSLRQQKYWVPVGRADNVHGDRNLVCSCPPLSDYE